MNIRIGVAQNGKMIISFRAHKKWWYFQSYGDTCTDNK